MLAKYIESETSVVSQDPEKLTILVNLAISRQNFAERYFSSLSSLIHKLSS